jgi:hypothetical protein
MITKDGYSIAHKQKIDSIFKSRYHFLVYLGDQPIQRNEVQKNPFQYRLFFIVLSRSHGVCCIDRTDQQRNMEAV